MFSKPQTLSSKIYSKKKKKLLLLLSIASTHIIFIYTKRDILPNFHLPIRVSPILNIHSPPFYSAPHKILDKLYEHVPLPLVSNSFQPELERTISEMEEKKVEMFGLPTNTSYHAATGSLRSFTKGAQLLSGS